MNEFIKLKPFVHVFKNGNSYVFFDYGNNKKIEINSKVNIDTYLKGLNKPFSMNEIKNEYKENSEYIEQLNDFLLHKGFLYENNSVELSKIEESLLFYSSTFKELSDSINKMRNANIAIIGVGGTGSWVCQELVMNQVGKLKLIDPDIVEYGNLQRQSLYIMNDIGSAKVDALKNHLELQNKFTKIETSTNRILDITDCINELSDADIIICTADEPSATQISSLINEYCIKKKKYMVATLGYTNAVVNLPFTYISTDCESSCVKCNYNKNSFFENYDLINKGTGGTPLTPVASILGSLIVLEVINIINNPEKSIFNKIKGTMNINNLEFYTEESQKDKKCKLCSGG